MNRLCEVSATGWIDGVLAHVQVVWGDDRADVCFIDGHRFSLTRTPQFTPGPPGGADDRGTGLGDVLQASWHHVFTLHASAVECNARTVALLGASGAGKSTLANHAAAQPGFRRVADDLLPLQISASSVEPVGIHQPKLSRADQRYGRIEAPLRALLWLEAIDDRSPPVLERLKPAAVFTRIQSDSVATRLLPQRLLEAQFDWACAMADRVPGFLLCRPWGLAHLPSVVKYLRQVVGCVAD